MSKKIIKDMTCEACGSWEFECREDGEYYCTTCSLPLVKKDDESSKKKQAASPVNKDVAGK